MVSPGSYSTTPYTLEDALASVGKGWHSLIREIFEKKPPQTAIVQVKEKFGSLRVYTTDTTDDFESLLQAFEARSETICELCGEPGEIGTRRGSTWMQALCRKHYGNENEVL